MPAFNRPIDEVRIASYGINGWSYNASGSANARLRDQSYNNADDMPDATNVPWFGDSTWRNSWPEVTDAGSTNGQVPWPVSPPTGLIQWQMDRHPGQNVNMGFADGHAEPVKVDDLDQLLWHKSWPTDGSVAIDTNW